MTTPGRYGTAGQNQMERERGIDMSTWTAAWERLNEARRDGVSDEELRRQAGEEWARLTDDKQEATSDD